MARPRKNIPQASKARIIEACGHKCANPGCHTRRVEIHHIREWAIWETNDEQHLIALCPTCHDAAHHGSLKLDDAMLYHWKTLPRAKPMRDVFQIETGPQPIFFVADSAVCTRSAVANVIDFTETSRVIFRIDEDDFFLVNLSISTPGGDPLLQVKDNRVLHSPGEFLHYQSRPGRIQVSTTDVERCVPKWLREQVARFDHSHAWNGAPAGTDHFSPPFTLLDIEVVAPSQVRMRGAICSPTCALFVRGNQIYFASPAGCSGVSGFGQFILRGSQDAFCASPSRASYYKVRGGGALLVPDF